MMLASRTASATAITLVILLALIPAAPVFAQDPQYRLPRPARNVDEVLLATAQEQAAPPAPDASELTITVLEGENGVNIIKKKTAVQPVVEVRDKNKLPVSGAAVTFTLPGTGAGGTFANGTHVLTLVTDSSGRAVVTGMHPVGTGAFKINVTASAQGHTAHTTISQTNYLTAAAAGGAAAGGLSALAIGGIVAGAVVVAVVVAVVATRGNGSSASQSATTSGSIGIGTGVTFGGPH